MTLILQDLKFAARGLLKSPGFTAVAVITLALGIGANTAIFTVVNNSVLRALPYRDAHRLVALWGNNSNTKSDRDALAPDTLKDYIAGMKSFEEVAGFSPRWSFALFGEGEPQRLFGYFASASAFPMLGVQPIAGRTFTKEEDQPQGAPVILISYRLWQNRYGGREDVLGKTIRVDSGTATVIGVLPASFRWEHDDADIWYPIAQNPLWGRGRIARLFEIVGRLKPGVSAEQAEAEAQTLAAGLAAQYPANYKGITARIVPLQEDRTSTVRLTLFVLLGAVGLVLLVACANVANLVLARATGRFREVAIRTALGANRAHILRELLTESTLLAFLGGAAGTLLAWAVVRLLLVIAPADLPRRAEIALDPMALLFTAALSLLTGVLCGMFPAWQAWQLNLTGALKEGGRGGAEGAGRHRVRSSLVVAEVALSVVVVCGALLLVRSFAKLQAVNPGFQTDNIISLDLAGIGQDPARRMAAMEDLYRRLAILPSVIASGEVSRLPLAGVGGNPTTKFQVEGQQIPNEQLPEVDFRRASRDYFRTMGIPLVSGRMFAETDGLSAQVASTMTAPTGQTPLPQQPAVILLNQAAAELLFPGVDPLGKRMTMSGGSTFEIVGVVGNIRHVGLGQKPRPETYMHTLQGPLSNPQIVVRTSSDAAAMISSVRRTIREAMPEAVVDRVNTMAQVRYQSLAVPRFNTMLFSAFSVLALVLALVGTYGVMAYNVSQRRQEIGIRMTLGALPADVLRMVLKQGLALALTGIALGLVGAFAATRWMRTMLYEVSPTDPLTFAAVVVLLALVAALACVVPAWRAARVDPLVALRYE